MKFKPCKIKKCRCYLEYELTPVEEGATFKPTIQKEINRPFGNILPPFGHVVLTCQSCLHFDKPDLSFMAEEQKGPKR